MSVELIDLTVFVVGSMVYHGILPNLLKMQAPILLKL